MLKVPFFFFSPRVAFLDDNKIFLESLGAYLSEAYETFTTSSPTSFIDELKKSSIQTNLLDLVIQEDDYSAEQSMVSINLINLHSKLLELFAKKKPISVAFIDFDMPQEDGVSVCKKITYVGTKKVFLTGELDEAGAVEAFNEGLIAGYLNKNSEEVIEQIKGSIERLHSVYLEELGNLYLPFLVKNLSLLELYGIPTFCELFSKILKQYSITQGCIYEMSGSQFLKDREGNAYLINVYGKEEIDYLVLPHLEEILLEDAFKNELLNFQSVLDYKSPQRTEIPDLKEWKNLTTSSFSIIKSSKSTYFVTFKAFDSSGL